MLKLLNAQVRKFLSSSNNDGKYYTRKHLLHFEEELTGLEGCSIALASLLSATTSRQCCPDRLPLYYHTDKMPRTFTCIQKIKVSLVCTKHLFSSNGIESDLSWEPY